MKQDQAKLPQWAQAVIRSLQLEVGRLKAAQSRIYEGGNFVVDLDTVTAVSWDREKPDHAELFTLSGNKLSASNCDAYAVAEKFKKRLRTRERAKEGAQQ